MHTTTRATGIFRAALASGVLFLVSLFGGASAAAQPSFPGTPDGTGVNVRVYPADLWTPRVGPGVGAGFVVHNLARPNDQWLLTAAPAQHEQVATAAFASANPQRARRYVLVNARALHTDRDWLGPASGRTVLERSSLRGRVRAGQSFLNRRALIQPHLTLTHHHADAVKSPAGGPSVAAALPAPGASQTGLRAGVDLRFDTRNQAEVTTRGVLLQATWDRYVPLDGTALRFDQVDLDAYGYVPLGGVHRLATRLSMTLTRNRDDAPVPVYMLPTVGGAVVPGWARGRFVAADRLLASALYRFPLLHYENLFTLDGHLGAHVAGTYDALDDQFSTSVSFDENVLPTGDSRPLRPSASAGLRFAMPEREHVSIELAAGVSPEGVSVVRFSLVRSLQSLRPAHHASENVR